MLVLYFDYPSPAAAVAALRLQELADAGLEIAFVGVDVLMLATSVPATLDQLDELTRCRDEAQRLDLVMRRPAVRPATLPAHLVGELAEVAGRGAAWRRRCLRAYWSEGVDLGDEAVLADLATDVGLERARVSNVLADRAARAGARRRMLELRRRGIGGVPVIEAHGTFVAADLPEEDLKTLAGGG